MYKEMSNYFPEHQEIGDFKIDKFIIKPDDFLAIIRYGIKPGVYVRLMQKNHGVIMSDTDMEKLTNADFVKRANGSVLIGGLGIGLIVLAIQEKNDVSHIDIIEKNKEVIDLVADKIPLNSKVNIIHDDVLTYIPKHKYDTIYMDIWNYVNIDIYNKEMSPLMKKYRKYLVSKNENEKRFIDCLAKKQAKNNTPL